MARTTKYSAEMAQRICDSLRNGSTRRAACWSNGICEDTFANWLKSKSDFSEQVKQAEALAEIKFTDVIADAAKNGDVKAALEWLKRRRRDDWGDSEKVELSGEVNQVVKILKGVSMDDL